MKNKINILAVLLLLLTVGLGCSGLKDVTKFADKNAEPKIITSTDNKIQLQVPATWSSTTTLNDIAILQVNKPISELYTIVIDDKKVDLEESADLDFITVGVRTNVEQTLTNPKFGDIVSIKINGFDAEQFEVSGSMDKLKVNYIYTTIETPDSFYQIVSWTIPSLYKENKETLLNIVNSFKLADKSVKKSSKAD